MSSLYVSNYLEIDVTLMSDIQRLCAGYENTCCLHCCGIVQMFACGLHNKADILTKIAQCNVRYGSVTICLQ
jgi:hypothetical protein